MRPPVTVRRSPLPRSGSAPPYGSESKARPAVGGPRGLARPSSVAALSCLLLCLALLSGCGVLGGSGAACAQDLPSVVPSRAGSGETFVLSGGGFGGGCDDSNLPFWPEPPQREVRIEMRQEGKTWSLATADAGGPPDYTIEETLEVPRGAEPGRAVVVVHRTNGLKPMEIPFRVLGGGPG